jgi:hypothetical protein
VKGRSRDCGAAVSGGSGQEPSDAVSQFVSLVSQFTDIHALMPEIVAAFSEKVTFTTR